MKSKISRRRALATTAVTPRMAAAGFAPVAVSKGARRAAMLLPKPRKRRMATPPMPASGLTHLEGELGPEERRAMRALCQTADLFVVGDQSYLLAPVTPALVDTLAAFESDDREPDDAPELDDPPEIGDPDEANGDQEPDEPDEASLQLAAKVVSLQMLAITMGHYAPGASYDWEPGGTKAGKVS